MGFWDVTIKNKSDNQANLALNNSRGRDIFRIALKGRFHIPQQWKPHETLDSPVKREPNTIKMSVYYKNREHELKRVISLPEFML